MKKDQFEAFVSAVLAENPDWIDAAIRAITSGQREALERARHSAGEARNAMTLALILANKRGKLDDHMMGLISEQIIKMIGTPSCGAEHGFIDEHKGTAP